MGISEIVAAEVEKAKAWSLDNKDRLLVSFFDNENKLVGSLITDTLDKAVADIKLLLGHHSHASVRSIKICKSNRFLK